MIGWQDTDAGVGVVTLARPPVNAFDWPAKRELHGLLAGLAERSDVRCIIFRSDLARVFCAGSDLHELARDHDQPGAATERTRFEFEMWQRLSGLPQVSIAAIEGHALGSGLELAIACDVRIAGADASLGLPEVKIGGAPGTQTLGRLASMVGSGTARRMILSGDSLTAEEAWSVGLVDEVSEAGEAFPTAWRMARMLADRPSSSVRFLKAALAAATDAAMDRVGVVVDDGIEALFQAPEMREGIRAFLEKREPDFHAATLAARDTQA